MSEREALFHHADRDLVAKYVTTRVGQIPEAVGRLLAAHCEAVEAIREWFAAEDAFDAIGIEGFDRPPGWYEARERCDRAIERLHGVLDA